MCGVCVISGVMGVAVTAWLAGCPPAERLSDVDRCCPSDTVISEPPVEDVGLMRSARCVVREPENHTCTFRPSAGRSAKNL